MTRAYARTGLPLALLFAAVALGGCGRDADTGLDPNVTTKGSIEVTARLVEVPEGAIFKKDLYDYAAVLKYQVLQVHRGQVTSDVLYIAHYNPFKPRTEAADDRVQRIGGNLRAFQGGQVHRMALEVPIDDHFMGGVIDKYFGQYSAPIHWAVWTNLVSE